MRVFLIGFLCPFFCYAASLDELIGEAVSAAPEFSAFEAEINAARAGLKQSGYHPNPELSGELGVKSTDTDEGYAASVSLLQTFERGGKRRIRQALAQHDVRAAALLLDQFKRDLAVRVWRLAVGHAIAVQDEALARELGERCRAMIALLKQRPTAGAPVLLELRVIEASLLEFQSAERDADAREKVSRAELNALRNRPPSETLHLDVSIDLPPESDSWDVLLARLDECVELRIQTSAAGRAALAVDDARAQSQADIGAGPFVSVEDAGEQEIVGGIALNLTSPLWHRNQGGIAVAEARKKGAESAIAVARRELEIELARAAAELDSARQRLRGITAADVRAIAEAAALADRQYRLGAISVQLFLDLQREYLNVLQLRSEAMREGWNAALEIERLTADVSGASP